MPAGLGLLILFHLLILNIMMELKDQFAELIKNGATEISNVVVKSVYVTNKGDYSLVTMRVNKDVKGIDNTDDEYKLVDNSRTVFVYDHDIMRIISEMPELALFKRMFANEPSVLETVLAFAKIDVVQIVIKANEEFVSPFSGRANDVRDYDSVRTYIKSITLGEEGESFVAGLRKEYQKLMIQRLMTSGITNGSRNHFDED